MTSFCLSSDIAARGNGLGFGLVLPLETSGGYAVWGENGRDGIGLVMGFAASAVSGESESEVTTTAMSTCGHRQDHSLIDARALAGSNAFPLSLVGSSSVEFSLRGVPDSDEETQNGTRL
jgi:hypothetical protein